RRPPALVSGETRWCMPLSNPLARSEPAETDWPTTSLVSARSLLSRLPRRRLLLHATPLAAQVKLTIAAPRPSYVVGEPLQLRISVRDTGRGPVRGYFVLDPASGELEIWHRLNGGAWGRLGRSVHWGCFLHRSKLLEAGAELSEEVVVAFDHARQKPLFSEPGCCDVRVLYQDVMLDDNAALASNTITLQVARPYEGAGW